MTKAELEQHVKELEAANTLLEGKNWQLALTMREAVHNGDRWRRQFWLLVEMMEVYVNHNPNRVDKQHGDPLGQARMIASIDPQDKKWSVFWQDGDTSPATND